MQVEQKVQDFNPLHDAPPSEVKLERAPLALVVTQLRFASIPKIEEQAHIASFQERMRKEYPLLSEDKVSFALNLPSQGVGHTRTLWRMNSFDNGWRLILCQDFIALETDRYQDREDFLGRWERIVAAFTASFDAVVGLRYGLRYLNRVTDPALLERLPELVRTEALGVTALLPRPTVALTEMQIPVAEGQMLARWGLLPAAATHDPSIVPSPWEASNPWPAPSVVAAMRSSVGWSPKPS